MSNGDLKIWYLRYRRYGYSKPVAWFLAVWWHKIRGY
jgi:hypothetical protein